MTRFFGVVAALASGFFGAQANTPIPKPVCDASKDIAVRYSSTSQRIYIESVDGSRGGCADPTTVYQALGAASPLYPLETPGEWGLEESLFILDGITLNLYGTDVGGDCDYLKLHSDSETVVNVRAHGGSLDLLHTKVTSWDSSKGDVDSDWGDGRSYISAISEIVLDSSERCQGAAKKNMGEARMDVENCEIAYLGYEESESWGLSWKLRGVCSDKTNLDQYEGYGVYGNLLGSDVHDLYYGHYGYKHSFAMLRGNSVYNNEVYGFDPHDDSVNLTISHNDIYSNFHHGVIWSKYCHNAVVTNNHVHDNGGVGIFPHFVSDNAMIAHNTIERNGDSGIAFLESSGGLVYNNTVRDNVHGIRFSVGSRNNVVVSNTFEANTGYDLYQYAGNDPVVEVDSGNPTNNVFLVNVFSGNTGGARLDDSIDTQFVSNTVHDWAGFEMGDSVNTLVLRNTFPVDMTYISSGSCINSASDVAFGDFCNNDAINPLEVETGATPAPSGSQMYSPISTSSSDSSSPSVSLFFTTSPTASPTDVPRNMILTSDSSSTTSDSGDNYGVESGDGGGDEGSGGGNGDTGVSGEHDTDGFETMSPTPTNVPGIPGISVEDDDVARGLSGGLSLTANGAAACIGSFVVGCLLL